MTDPTPTTPTASAVQAPDAIASATTKLNNALDSVGNKGGEVAALVGVVVTHFNNLLASLGADVKIGISAAEHGIGGVATLTVSTENALKDVAQGQSSEPLATPTAGF